MKNEEKIDEQCPFQPKSCKNHRYKGSSKSRYMNKSATATNLKTVKGIKRLNDKGDNSL